MKYPQNTLFTSVVIVGLTTLLTACGGDQQSQKTDKNTPHPLFSRAAVITSNAYAPTGEISDTKPTFKWKATNGATEYQFGHEDVDTALRWQEYNVSAIEAGCSRSFHCSFKPTDIELAKGDEKVWWIRGKTANGWQPWSAPIRRQLT